MSGFSVCIVLEEFVHISSIVKHLFNVFIKSWYNQLVQRK